jgi:hypothetical protein
MTAIKVHSQMMDYVSGGIAEGVIGDRVMTTAGQPKINPNAYLSDARARCGSCVLLVTRSRETYILGDGYASWRRQATPEEIARLPDTRGENRGPSIPDAWFGER